jgi:hypothetical protein
LFDFLSSGRELTLKNSLSNLPPLPLKKRKKEKEEGEEEELYE